MGAGIRHHPESSVRRNAVYVFAITNAAGEQPTLFVVRGVTLRAREKRLWGKWDGTYERVHGRGLSPTALDEWKDNWGAIDE